MTDESEITPMKEPPKINLGGLAAPVAAPPVIKLTPPPTIVDSKKEPSKQVPAPERAPEVPTVSKIVLSPTPKPATPAIPDVAGQPPAAEQREPQAPPQVPTVSEVMKSRTIQIGDIQEESLDDLYKAALNATQRVVLEERKAETGKIDAIEQQKKSTARLDVQEMLSEEPTKPAHLQETMHIDMEGQVKPKPAGTMKIQRPAAPPPPSATMHIAMPSDLEDAEKSKTARIELPREIVSTTPPSQRKTIRIKRPDGTSGPITTARPALSVARKGTSATSSVQLEDTETVASRSTPAAPSPLVAIAAIIAVLFSIAVVYVLVATVSSGLPFPGRLV